MHHGSCVQKSLSLSLSLSYNRSVCSRSSLFLSRNLYPLLPIFVTLCVCVCHMCVRVCVSRVCVCVSEYSRGYVTGAYFAPLPVTTCQECLAQGFCTLVRILISLMWPCYCVCVCVCVCAFLSCPPAVSVCTYYKVAYCAWALCDLLKHGAVFLAPVMASGVGSSMSCDYSLSLRPSVSPVMASDEIAEEKQKVAELEQKVAELEQEVAKDKQKVAELEQKLKQETADSDTRKDLQSQLDRQQSQLDRWLQSLNLSKESLNLSKYALNQTRDHYMKLVQEGKALISSFC